jgi:hypothetical protein
MVVLAVKNNLDKRITEEAALVVADNNNQVDLVVVAVAAIQVTEEVRLVVEANKEEAVLEAETTREVDSAVAAAVVAVTEIALAVLALVVVLVRQPLHKSLFLMM